MYVNTNTYWPTYPSPAPCPSCGHCPTCGRHYPYHHQITWGGGHVPVTTGGSTVQNWDPQSLTNNRPK